MARLLYSCVILYVSIKLLITMTEAWPNYCNSRVCHGYCCGSGSGTCCKGCNGVIENCADLRCTTSSNRYCYKCDFDRGGGKMAFEPVDYGSNPARICEQRCSWRTDSKFCYPGTCPLLPASCTCLNGFGGDNCLTINSKPIINACNGHVQRSGSTSTCTFDCSDDNTLYCGVNGERFLVDWVASYDPSLSSINRPYYINDTGFGIVSAVLNWKLMRDRKETDSGLKVCLSEESHILNIQKSELPRRSCSHTIGITTTVRHNDRFVLVLKTKNSGYIKINNYDQEDVVIVDEAKFYSEQITEKTTEIFFDFAAPQHCIITSFECKTDILDIGNPYRMNSDITVKWEPEDWNDVPSGIDHFDCEAYRLTSDPAASGLLGMGGGAPYALERNIDRTVKSVQLNLPDAGVFAIILTVTDTVGNSAKVRRFLTYDPDSVISVDKDKPIMASEGAFNAGLVWLTQSKGEITVTWSGHFYNAFYRDGNLLNGIQKHDPPLGPYDESTGLPPSSRSRLAIPNDNGIVKFRLGFVESSSGRDEPENWVDIGEGKTSYAISITDDSNEYITILMKAYDVMNNTREEKATFFIDKTEPIISDMTVIDSDAMDAESSLLRFKRTAMAGPRVSVQAHDDESGILEIRWQVMDKMDSNRVYGEGRVTETSPVDNQSKPCTALTCACIPHGNTCFYLKYLLAIDITDFPEDNTECIVRITVVNNAMLETSDEVEILLGSAASTGSNAGIVVGSTVGAVAAVTIIIAILIALIRPNMFKNLMNDRCPCFHREGTAD